LVVGKGDGGSGVRGWRSLRMWSCKHWALLKKIFNGLLMSCSDTISRSQKNVVFNSFNYFNSYSVLFLNGVVTSKHKSKHCHCCCYCLCYAIRVPCIYLEHHMTP
jgi:hypothetical protein